MKCNGHSETPPFPSPFLHLLETNYAPEADVIKKIIEFLHKPEQKLCALNNQIARLEETLERLKSTRNSLQAHISSHRALLSPFRRLPEDVVREVFIRCSTSHPIRSTKHAPLLLTMISKSWRQIALTTPCLW
ncbi:hypothetical protein L218DRAFT_859871, partial [Marasmius fiardii PR-910]